MFKLGCIFYHLIPGFLTDLVLRLQGRKPILMKSYPKIHEALLLLYPFSGRTIIMDTNNTTKMWDVMSAWDRAIFPFDMANFNWDDYFSRIVTGMRVFLLRSPGIHWKSPNGDYLGCAYCIAFLKFCYTLLSGH
ncbi:fatty acyl-CoA reductase wat-like [Drosophila ficusphila]|uniref:fatty acyl-CoA reductase wat-like n=1 Tax=Drosophila ficusphila TaxID=30025 RepID=UPI001C895EC9|nr:fatty acyl-CoA reductase wat-like [Drosophila ficusphila]